MGASETNPKALPEEKPQHSVYLDGFWIDQTEITNRMFSKFVEATGYATDAEKDEGSWLWTANGERKFYRNVNWRHPHGADNSVEELESHPVVQVSWNDAGAYCKWAG